MEDSANINPFIRNRLAMMQGVTPTPPAVSPTLMSRLQEILGQYFFNGQMGDPRAVRATIDPSRNMPGVSATIPQWSQPQTNAFERMMPPPPSPGGGAMDQAMPPQMAAAPPVSPDIPAPPPSLPQAVPTAGTPGFNPSAPNAAVQKMRALAGFAVGNPEAGGGRLRDPSMSAAMAGSGVGFGDTRAMNDMPQEQPQAAQSSGGGFLKDFLGRNPNLPDALMIAGLGGMAAGSKPGATVLGALGEGGLAAVQEMDRRKRLDIQERQLDRQIKQGDEKLGIEREKVKGEAEDRILRRQQDAANHALTIEQRREAARDANETRRLLIESNSGNRQATLELQKMLAENRQEETGRRADNDAATFYRHRMEQLEKANLGAVTPEMTRAVEDEVASSYPKSSMARNVVNRQFSETVQKIKSSSLPDAEKEKRIDEARKRMRETLGE